MHRCGRAPVPQMGPEEVFYYRVEPDHVQPDRTVDPMHIKVFDLSSNRSRFSEPWYVLYPRTNCSHCAVFRFRIQDLPQFVTGDGKDAKPHELRTEHSPDEDNFGHCETRVYKDGQRLPKENKLKDGPKAKMKMAFSFALKFERAAGEPFPPPGWIDPGCPPIA